MTEVDNVTQIPKKLTIDDIEFSEPDIHHTAMFSSLLISGAADSRVFNLLERLQSGTEKEGQALVLPLVTVLAGNTLGNQETMTRMMEIISELAGYDDYDEFRRAVPPNLLLPLIRKMAETENFKDFLQSAPGELRALFGMNTTSSPPATAGRTKKSKASK